MVQAPRVYRNNSGGGAACLLQTLDAGSRHEARRRLYNDRDKEGIKIAAQPDAAGGNVLDAQRPAVSRTEYWVAVLGNKIDCIAAVLESREAVLENRERYLARYRIRTHTR